MNLYCHYCLLITRNEGMHWMFKENFRYLNEIGKYSQSSVRSNKISTQISPLPSPLSDSKLNLVSESSQITNASREPFSVKVSEVQFKNNLITPSIKKPTINGQKLGELKVDEILPIQNKKRSFAASENIPSLTEIQKRKVDELNNNALIRKKYKYLYA